MSVAVQREGDGVVAESNLDRLGVGSRRDRDRYMRVRVSWSRMRRSPARFTGAFHIFDALSGWIGLPSGVTKMRSSSDGLPSPHSKPAFRHLRAQHRDRLHPHVQDLKNWVTWVYIDRPAGSKPAALFAPALLAARLLTQDRERKNRNYGR